jgi:hypothetical protein
MSKISVKPYLNTNVKPQVIDGDKYYPVYILVRAKGRNTRVRSHHHQGVYTEKEFNGQNIANTCEEIPTVETLVNAQLLVDGETFDTVLFATLYNLLPKHPVRFTHFFLFELHSNWLEKEDFGMSFYDWFKPTFQKHVIGQLKKKSIVPTLALNSINASLLYSFFGILADVAKAKPTIYQAISARYKPVFKNFQQLGVAQLQPFIPRKKSSTKASR